MAYWLLKSEPLTFSIDHLKQAKNQTDFWDGVRNYQARNFIKTMRKNDLAFFYHSNCEVPAIVGVMKITSNPYADHTAFDKQSKYYDEKATKENPRWFGVDVTFKEKFNPVLPLAQLKTFDELCELPLVRKGNRLSVMPVSKFEWEFINQLA